MNIAVIFAGGVGKRMKTNGMPKQFLKIDEIPIIIHTLNIFNNTKQIEAIVIACVNTHIEYLKKLVKDYNIFKVKSIIAGGRTGQESIIKALEEAKLSKVKSMVYMSSMEMYGTLNSNNVDEQMQGFIDPLNSRSSYSQGKRTCELYSYSYFYEYGIPVKIARIAQTFGAGISKTENRVYKVFADAVLSQQDIVLKSAGTTIINFSYTTDTVIGILCILLNGKNGEAYNIVSDKTNMTILDSAKWLAEIYGNGKVRIEIPKENSGYAPNNNMILNNNKLKSIGWSFKYDIKHGYDRLLKYLRENN